MEDDELFSEDMTFFEFNDALKKMGFFKDDTYRYTTLCVLNNPIFQIFVYNYGECAIHKRHSRPDCTEAKQFSFIGNLQTDVNGMYIRPGVLLNIIEESKNWDDFMRRVSAYKINALLEKM